jgi:hypothetical protein
VSFWGKITKMENVKEQKEGWGMMKEKWKVKG